MTDTRGERGRTPDEALAQLLAGNARYVASTVFHHDFSAKRAGAVKGQTPLAGVLACADSRVASEIIFDCGPGDLFMVRVAGNFLSDYGLASLEYAVHFLHVPLLMVLGHTQCGAVTSALQVVENQTVLPGRLPFLIDAVEPAVHLARRSNPEDLLSAAILENVRRQADRLAKVSPVINEVQAAGKVKVVGAVYDLATGKVTCV